MDKGEFLVMTNQQTLNISVAFNGACRCQCSMSRSIPVTKNNLNLESFSRKENEILTTQKNVEA